MLQEKKIILLLIGLIVLIFFESGQQYYYIITFDLTDTAVSYWDILISHAYRWAIWLVLSIPFWYWLSHKAPRETNLSTISVHAALLLLMLGLNLLSMSFLQILRFSESFSLADLSELLTFYGFQKGPIYLIAYLLTYVYFFYEQRVTAYELLVKDHKDLKHLLDLENQHSTLTNERQGASMLTAKIGDSKHLIPVDQIKYIEADDYCVDIHTDQDKKFVLRASLKHLEHDLPESFIRVHRSFLVNFNYVTKLKLGDKRPHIITTSGESIPVARSRCAQLNKLTERSVSLAG